ncbi:MAG: divergent polysaccharide deacetylase family protein [Desulfobacterales bacterium]
MAKSQPKKKTSPGASARTKGAKSRKPSRRKKRTPSIGLTLLKMTGALCILAVLVAGAGLLLHFGLKRPEPTSPAAVAKAVSKPPVYEVYPKAAAPVPKAPAEPGKSTPARKDVRSDITPPDARPPLEKLPRVAIIIDDIGYDKQLADAFMAFDVPLTFSVLPESPFQESITRKLRAKGYELMLHLPMEPVEYPEIDPGPGALLRSMTPDELIVQLNRDIEGIPGIKGVNNHMGSRLTAESSQMYQIFTVLKKRNLFFIDSRSSAETVARPSARLFQLPFAERDVFIDHVQDPAFIRKQFRELVRAAKRQGEAVGIAHPHPLTVKMLEEALPDLRRSVRIVPASEIVHVIE